MKNFRKPGRRSRSETKPDSEVIAGSERIQKVMAAAGLGSRRGLEKQIEAGTIIVNGKPATLGLNVTLNDRISMGQQEWRVVSSTPRHRCIVYNKPDGEVTTRSDPQKRPTVFDRLPRLRGRRWIAVGRLDINTTGLLLLTTDGELAHALMHPSNKVDREYACRVRGPVSSEVLERLRKGVELDDGPAHFSDIVESGGSGGNVWFHVTILEGRNREVRRLWASQGITVSRLKRVRYGAVFLPKHLHMGRFHELENTDLKVLREDVGLSAPSAELLLRADKKRGKRR